MGYRRYKGRVTNLEQAMFADFPVALKCEICGRLRRMHSFTLIQLVGTKADARKLPLWQRIENLFMCKRCKRRVPVTICAPMQWAD